MGERATCSKFHDVTAGEQFGNRGGGGGEREVSPRALLDSPGYTVSLVSSHASS